MNRTKKVGAILLYCVTVLNLLISVFLTPFILSCLGDSEYGVYRTVQALTGQLGLISLGLGTIASVFLAKYNARTDERVAVERENFMAMGMIIATAISCIVFVVGMGLYLFVDDIYAKTMNAEQLGLVRKMFVVLVANMALHMFDDIFQGALRGYERFVFSNGAKVARLLLRAAVIVVLLNMGFGALALVWCDLALTIALVLCDVGYCFGILKLKAKFHYWDKALFGAVFSFSFAMFLQAIVNQVNQNLDNVILGATIALERVAVYSLALTIYSAFCVLTSSMTSLFTPQAARIVQCNPTQSSLMEFVIKVGRLQCAVACLIAGGFLAAGRQFVSVWVGAERMDVFYLILILILPAGIAAMLSGANCVLDGYMKRLGRSAIMIVTAAINLVSSLILIQFLDYWGAAIGTALSVVLGQVFAMCLHYRRVFGFKPLTFFCKTFRGILPCVLLAQIVTIPLSYLSLDESILLLIKGAAYVVVYGAGLWLFGLNEEEKRGLIGRAVKQK